ncbi:2-oxoglutarate dehydrogenase E1 subunit family protein, partial [Tsukamurella pulmonis]
MSSSSVSDFGQNEWLVEEMYERFKADPNSVDPSWHEFLSKYTPGVAQGSDAGSNGAAPAAAAASPAPAAQPAAASSAP